MSMTKEAKAEALTKIAKAEKFDKEQAFEIGFAKAASDLGLSDTEFKNFYDIGVQTLVNAKR